MKTQEEIEQLADEYIKDGIYLSDSEKQQTEIAYMSGYNQCQEDMASKKLDVDDIDEMALDYIINNGGLPDSVEEFQHCLHKFYEQINKQD